VDKEKRKRKRGIVLLSEECVEFHWTFDFCVFV